jgi:GNAT superfamily N-acetyltransferase
MNCSFQPLTNKNWKDFVLLFGPKGACGGCWCMTWRLNSADYNRMKGEENKKAMQHIVSKSSPGIIAYADDTPAGWCAIAPRKEYIRLETSRILQRVDEKEVWSVSCFFIKKDFRRKGLSTVLLKAAAKFAFEKGALIIEGYPTDAKKVKAKDGGKNIPAVFVWTGLAATFLNAGFKETARRSDSRPIMRLYKN